MEGSRERRTEGRIRVRSKVQIVDQETGRALGEFELIDMSRRGISFRSWDRFEPGRKLWCEVDDYELCAAAKVYHSRGVFRKFTGVQFVDCLSARFDR